MGLAQLLIDNPILVKHARSRLRPGQAIPAVAIVFVLSVCVVWAGQRVSWVSSATAAIILMGGQLVLIALAGTSQLNNSLGRARESGILDFHRVSPLPPSVVVLGFFFGAPIREYLLAAVIVPFAAWSAYFAHSAGPRRGLSWMAQLEVALLLASWLFHAIVVLACLTRKKPRGSVIGIIITLIVALYFVYGAVVGFYLGAQFLLETDQYLNFFGRTIPWLLGILIYALPALGFLMLAAVRKMKSERMHAFSKIQAVDCLAALVLLTIGGLWNLGRFLPSYPPNEPAPSEFILIGAVYVLTFVAMILAATITPDANEYLKGLLRARHEGRKRPSPLSDSGSNRAVLFGMCALVLVGATLLTTVVDRTRVSGIGQFDAWTARSAIAARQAHLSRPIAIGVLTIAYVGLGLQYLVLQFRRSGKTIMALFLFVVWLLPLLAGGIVGLGSSLDSSVSLAVLALSPVPGLALSAGFRMPVSADAIKLAAVAPPVAFAFVFNYLLVVIQRKLDRAMRGNDDRALALVDPPRS